MSYFTGLTGPPGLIGIIGNTGLTGTQGIYGKQGATGPPGIQGPSGIQGMDGPQGIPGLIGPAGPIGPRGPTGEKGCDGPAGPVGITGIAYASTENWTMDGKNMYVSSGNIGIRQPNPAYTLDVSGSVNISKISYVTNMCEYINTLTASATNTYNINYANGSLFYLSTPPTATMRVNIFNLPSLTDTTHSYILNFIYKGTSANYYINTVNVTNTSTAGAGVSNITPKFIQTVYISTITSSNLIFQTIVYFYLGSTSYVISSVNGYAT